METIRKCGVNNIHKRLYKFGGNVADTVSTFSEIYLKMFERINHMSEEIESRDKELRVRLNKRLWHQLDIIKENYGFESYSDLVRLIIREKYEEIKRREKVAEI